MSGFGIPFARDAGGDFDAYDGFAPEHLPEPGGFLADHDVLEGLAHCAFHRLTRDLFEARGVYDATFGYNLARLSLDRRHPDAGFRYAVEQGLEDAGEDPVAVDDAHEDPVAVDDAHEDPVAVDDAREALVTVDGRVLRAEFTPTTPFCPQSTALTLGSFRAWNGLADRHEFDLVRVRIADMHHAAADINADLARLERAFVETGTVPDGAAAGHDPALATEDLEPGHDDADLPF